MAEAGKEDSQYARQSKQASANEVAGRRILFRSGAALITDGA